MKSYTTKCSHLGNKDESTHSVHEPFYLESSSEHVGNVCRFRNETFCMYSRLMIFIKRLIQGKRMRSQVMNSLYLKFLTYIKLCQIGIL